MAVDNRPPGGADPVRGRYAVASAGALMYIPLAHRGTLPSPRTPSLDPTRAMLPLPDSTRIEVPSALARDLLRAAERIPACEDKELYSLGLQAQIRDQVRAGLTEGYDWLAREVRDRLRRRPYFAVVSGLQFDEGHRLFVAINRQHGDLVSRPYVPPRARMVHYIDPTTDMKATSRRARFESEQLHTDGAEWREPVNLISMRCVRPDRNGGGYSLFLDLDALKLEVRDRLGPEALALLEEPVPWQVPDYQEGGVAWRPVVTASSVRWRRRAIDLALENEGVDLPEHTVDVLDALERLTADTEEVRTAERN